MRISGYVLCDTAVKGTVVIPTLRGKSRGNWIGSMAKFSDWLGWRVGAVCVFGDDRGMEGLHSFQELDLSAHGDSCVFGSDHLGTGSSS